MRFQPKSCASTLTGPKRCEGRTGRREEQPLPKIAAPREAQDHGVNRNERPGDGGPKSHRQQQPDSGEKECSRMSQDSRP
jgi:hypothetical protein